MLLDCCRLYGHVCYIYIVGVCVCVCVCVCGLRLSVNRRHLCTSKSLAGWPVEGGERGTGSATTIIRLGSYSGLPTRQFPSTSKSIAGWPVEGGERGTRSATTIIRLSSYSGFTGILVRSQTQRDEQMLEVVLNGPARCVTREVTEAVLSG